MELLRTDKLRKSFGGLHAVDKVSFSVRPGIIKAIIGPNGAGKTTLFNLISGVYPLNSGRVFFKQKEITGLPSFKIAALGLARTFQTTRLFSHMTVLENIMVGRHVKSKGGFFSCFLSLPWTWKEEFKIRQSSEQILADMGLADLMYVEAGNLPFGKQRLVEFARAIAMEPELLLLDEPAAGLNIYETNELAGTILKIKEMGITILLVEHDMSLVMDISNEILVLDRGRALKEGPPADIQKDEEVIKVYLGEEDA